MPALSIQPTYPIFTDIDGQPLENGYVWIGAANLDPQSNPINVYWDDALTQLAAQPIRTRGGYPVNAGTPARLYVNSDYSIRVTNKNGAAIYNAPEATERYSSELLTYMPAGTDAVATTVQSKLRETASVLDFGADPTGVADSTAAFKAAIAAARRIYLPAGTYLTNFGDAALNPDYITSIPNGTHFFGDGEATVWKPYSKTARGCIGTDSGSASAFCEDVRFSNIRFEGYVTTDGLLQTAHLVYLSGVKRALIEKCSFIGPRGDGLYIGSGFGGGPSYERHNFDVTVRDCYFDGVNNGNRNGIGVIDVDGMVIEGCRFTRLSDPTMPGSIDLEPDDSYSVIKNVRIQGNKFDNCTGSGGHVNVAVRNIPYANFANLIVVGNNFANSNGVVIETNSATPGSAPTVANNVIINGNTFLGVQWPLYKGVGSLWGLAFCNNQVQATFAGGGRVIVGHPTAATAANWRTRNLIVNDNVIVGNDPYILTCNESIQWGNIDNNIIDGATSACIRMGLAGTTTTNVAITNNKFLGTPTYTVDHTATTKNANGNVYRNNWAASAAATHTFQAYSTDNTGATSGVFNASTTPETFPLGESRTTINGASITAGGTEYGELRTVRVSSVAETHTYQTFVTRYNSEARGDAFIRKAVNATTWGDWTVEGGLSISGNFGDSAATLTVGISATTNRWASALTADRAVTLDITSAVRGARFRIVRMASATGAFNLNVGTGPLKSLAAGQWCDVEYSGSAWLLTAFGSL